MSKDLVLVTGASGYLGFRVVVNALEAGYNVRAAVRSQAKADVILAAASIQAIAPQGKLHFVFTPDILSDGAYDEAVKDVQYVIHTASPLPSGSDDYERDLLVPALKGTTGILKSAILAPTVKRIVITSSVVAVIPWEANVMEESDTIFTAKNRIPDSHAPFGNPFQAYCASKVNALNATDAFVKKENPQFDVINIMPSFLIGKSELINSSEEITSGTNRMAFEPILGLRADAALPSAQVDVDDAAKVHVLSLNLEVKGNQSFGVTSGGIAGNQWDAAIEVVKRRFPVAVEDGRLPANGTRPSKRVLIDASETEKVLGIKFRSFEDQIVSVTQHYLELLEQEKTATKGNV